VGGEEEGDGDEELGEQEEQGRVRALQHPFVRHHHRERGDEVEGDRAHLRAGGRSARVRGGGEGETDDEHPVGRFGGHG
jgi:hypothetical protein